MLITTINFDCSNYCDHVDSFHSYVKDDMILKLQLIIDEKDVGGDFEQCATMPNENLECWGISSPPYAAMR